LKTQEATGCSSHARETSARDKGGDEPEEVARAWEDRAPKGDEGGDFQRCGEDKDAVRGLAPKPPVTHKGDGMWTILEASQEEKGSLI
jgi:hypothetical protein